VSLGSQLEQESEAAQGTKEDIDVPKREWPTPAGEE
jgi:hypothetical protein